MAAPTEVEFDLSQIVVILAKEHPFLYIAPTFGDAVRYADLYLSGPSETDPGEGEPGGGYPGTVASTEEMRRLTAEELEFFSAGGMVLVAVSQDEPGSWILEVAADSPTDPTATQTSIRERITAAYLTANQRMTEQGNPERVELPAADCDYPTFIRTVMSDPKVGFDPRPNCSWLLRILGLCR